MHFFSPAFTQLISSLRLSLFNLLLHNLRISLKGPSNCVYTHGRIKVNVFIQKILIIPITMCRNFPLHEKCPNTEFFLVRIFQDLH